MIYFNQCLDLINTGTNNYDQTFDLRTLDYD